MPSPIVVEDGTGIVDANSYVSGDEIRAYAQARGYALVAAGDDFAGDVLLLPFVSAAMDYLQGLPYVGRQIDTEQALDWPRNHVKIDRVCYDAITIPTLLKRAEMQLVVEQLKGNSIDSSVAAAGAVDISFASPLADGTAIETNDGRFVKRQRLEGVSDREFSESVGTSTTAYLPLVYKFLGPLLQGGFSMQLYVSRG